MDETLIAVVTGANRGIGREVVRQLALRGYRTVLGSRDLAAGTEIAAQLAEETGADIVPCQLDVTDQASVDAAVHEIQTRWGKLDVLVNNAGAFYDDWQTAIDADLSVVEQAFDVNLLGPWRMTLAMLPLLRKGTRRRIVNVSSIGGSLESMEPDHPGYRVSKSGLNALTRMTATQLQPEGILVNAVCPGWTATDMGEWKGRPVEEGAAGVLWAVDIPDAGPTGGFFRNGQPLPW